MNFYDFISDVNCNAPVARGGEFLDAHKDEYPELRDAILLNLTASPDTIIETIASYYPIARYWKYSGAAKAYLANLQLFFLEKGSS